MMNNRINDLRSGQSISGNQSLNMSGAILNSNQASFQKGLPSNLNQYSISNYPSQPQLQKPPSYGNYQSQMLASGILQGRSVDFSSNSLEDGKNSFRLGTNPIEILAQLFSIFIEERPDYLSDFTSLERQFKYTLYSIQEEFKNKKPELKVKAFSCLDKAESCEKQYCRSSAAVNIDMWAHIVQNGQNAKINFLKLKQAYTCPIGGCDRPKMEVFYTGESTPNSNEGHLLGVIVIPCSCNEMLIEIFKDRNMEANSIFSIVADGRCGCSLPCMSEEGSLIEFDIRDNRKNASIGKIKKIFAGYFTEPLSDIDNYAINFPLELNWNEKALLMASFIAIDYRFFDYPKRVRTKGTTHPALEGKHVFGVKDPSYGRSMAKVTPTTSIIDYSHNSTQLLGFK